MKKAVFLYDYTGFMARPWVDMGYECWLFDGQHEPGISRDGLLVKVGMWFHHNRIEEHAEAIAEMVGDGVEIVFGFPECTHLTVAGNRHAAQKLANNPRYQEEAADLAMLVPAVANACGTTCWAAENPVGALSTLWRKPNFYFNPCDYGGYLPDDDVHPLYPDIYPPRDAYNKNTGIWCGKGFVRPEIMRVEPLYKENPGWKKCGGKSTRTKNIRSATPRGFALAVRIANANDSLHA